MFQRAAGSCRWNRSGDERKPLRQSSVVVGVFESGIEQRVETHWTAVVFVVRCRGDGPALRNGQMVEGFVEEGR